MPERPKAGRVDVLVAGAGPVGLLLAILLGRQGRSVLVAESRASPIAGSMAIGITPPSLRILREVELDGEFVDRGVPVATAQVYEDREPLGAVDFSRLPGAHRYILSLPQAETVALLRTRADTLPSVAVLDGTEVVDAAASAAGVRVDLRDTRSGERRQIAAAYLAGCDGHQSTVRRQTGIGWRSHRYACRFLMADFEDDTQLGDNAHLYFGPDGAVESFPLPRRRRRWIVQRAAGEPDPPDIASQVARRVRERVGVDLVRSAARFASAFQPACALAATHARGRVALCGDAAHVMSPIGGQGMNIGFGDAEQLARVLALSLDQRRHVPEAFDRYTAVRRRAVQVATRRAARGMWLGTRTGHAGSLFRRTVITRILFRPPVRERLAPYFAMLTLPQEPTGIPITGWKGPSINRSDATS